MKWNVYGIMFANVFLGEVEANSKEEAEEKAEQLQASPSLCHQCGGEHNYGLELGEGIESIKVEAA